MTDSDDGYIFDEVDNLSEGIKFVLQQDDNIGTDNEEFEPKEFAWIIDDFFTQLFNRGVGLLAGIIWVFVTYIFAGVIWFGLAYLLTSTEFSSQGINLALISITIGTFVLSAGANLVEYFDEEYLNFQAYVHNSVTFISSGVAFFGSFILKTLMDTQSSLSVLNPVANIVIFSINLIGGLLMMLSLWVILKLLWRLNQLVFWARDYESTMHPYSELQATIVGAKAGYQQTRPSSIGSFATLFSGFFLLFILMLVNHITGDLRLLVIVFGILIIRGAISNLLADHPVEKTLPAKIITIGFYPVYIYLPYYIGDDLRLSIAMAALIVLGIIPRIRYRLR